MPDITIYIPTYKRPQLLKHAIESALNQTWKNIQVIVSDNGSDDETAEVVGEFQKKDPRVKYYRHEKNGGLIFNYQFGLSVIDTEYYSFLSDDDLLLPWYCETAMESLKINPEIAFFAASTAIIDTKKQIVHIPSLLWEREGIYPAPSGYLQMIGKFPVPTSVMFRKSKTKEIQIDKENPVYWDCDYLMQIAAQYSIAISKKTCALFYTHPGGVSSSTNGPNAIRLIERIRQYPFIEKRRRDEGVKEIGKFFFPILAFTILRSCSQKDYEAAKGFYKQLNHFEVFPVRRLICGVLIGLCQVLPLAPILNLLKRIRKRFVAKNYPSEIQELVDRYAR